MNPSAPNFFYFFLLRICGVSAFTEDSANAEGKRFFWAKILRFFSKNYYINCRYDRRFPEDLRPPHYWQMNSNYGSLSRTLCSKIRNNLPWFTRDLFAIVILGQYHLIESILVLTSSGAPASSTRYLTIRKWPPLLLAAKCSAEPPSSPLPGARDGGIRRRNSRDVIRVRIYVLYFFKKKMRIIFLPKKLSAFCKSGRFNQKKEKVCR